MKTKFVNVAIDQANQRRQKDTEGEFYRKIVQQSPRKDFGNRTTQGLYVAAADGSFLGFTNNRHPEHVMRMLTEALKAYSPTEVAALKRDSVDERYNPEPDEDGLIVRVRAKIMGGYEETDDQWRKIFQSALSRDNLWITSDEHKLLTAGKFPESLATRIALYHLVDNTRGEPSMWKPGEIKKSEIAMKGNTLTGSFQLATGNGERTFDAQLLGKIEAVDGKVVRFDVVAYGDHQGEGRYTRGAPKGKFPLAISFELADGSDLADKLPPQAARHWLDGYYRAGK